MVFAMCTIEFLSEINCDIQRSSALMCIREEIRIKLQAKSSLLPMVTLACIASLT